MNFPHMLIMRNSIGGMVWQAYRVENQVEKEILTQNAMNNMFIVEEESEDFIEETFPCWRNTEEWKECLASYNGIKTPKKSEQDLVYEIMSKIKRDGPYWLGGYRDWLVACFSIGKLEEFHEFTPIACYSELVEESKRRYCVQYMLSIKDGEYYIDINKGIDLNRKRGIWGTRIEDVLLPSHIFDWAKSLVKNSE